MAKENKPKEVEVIDPSGKNDGSNSNA